MIRARYVCFGSTATCWHVRAGSVLPPTPDVVRHSRWVAFVPTAAINGPLRPRPKADQYVRNCSNAFWHGTLEKESIHALQGSVSLRCYSRRANNRSTAKRPNAWCMPMLVLSSAQCEAFLRRCGVYVAMTLSDGGRCGASSTSIRLMTARYSPARRRRARLHMR